MNSGLVVLMGLGTVFFGLICIIFVCKCMSFVISKIEKAPATVSAPATQAPVQNTAKTEAIPSRPELAAAIAAAIAEYTGRDISGIRIHSIKKL
jgi:sodium pump decarboxylase gamma subunit